MPPAHPTGKVFTTELPGSNPFELLESDVETGWVTEPGHFSDLLDLQPRILLHQRLGIRYTIRIDELLVIGPQQAVDRMRNIGLVAENQP